MIAMLTLLYELACADKRLCCTYHLIILTLRLENVTASLLTVPDVNDYWRAYGSRFPSGSCNHNETCAGCIVSSITYTTYLIIVRNNRC